MAFRPPQLEVPLPVSSPSASEAPSPDSHSRWRRVEFGAQGSLQYRVIIQDCLQRKAISPWHAAPLYAGGGQVNMVCTTPRGMWGEFEHAYDEELTPIRLRKRNNLPSHYSKGPSWNLGFLPQTCGDPDTSSEEYGNLPYADGPLSVVDVGMARTARSGDVYAVKVLAAFALLDSTASLSWKVVAIDASDPGARGVDDLRDLQRRMPQEVAEIREWLRTCQTVNQGDPVNVFCLNERPIDTPSIVQVVAQVHSAWQLMQDTVPNNFKSLDGLASVAEYEEMWRRKTLGLSKQCITTYGGNRPGSSPRGPSRSRENINATANTLTAVLPAHATASKSGHDGADAHPGIVSSVSTSNHDTRPTPSPRVVASKPVLSFFRSFKKDSAAPSAGLALGSASEATPPGTPHGTADSAIVATLLDTGGVRPWLVNKGGSPPNGKSDELAPRSSDTLPTIKIPAPEEAKSLLLRAPSDADKSLWPAEGFSPRFRHTPRGGEGSASEFSENRSHRRSGSLSARQSPCGTPTGRSPNSSARRTTDEIDRMYGPDGERLPPPPIVEKVYRRSKSRTEGFYNQDFSRSDTRGSESDIAGLGLRNRSPGGSERGDDDDDGMVKFRRASTLGKSEVRGSSRHDGLLQPPRRDKTDFDLDDLENALFESKPWVVAASHQPNLWGGDVAASRKNEPFEPESDLESPIYVAQPVDVYPPAPLNTQPSFDYQANPLISQPSFVTLDNSGQGQYDGLAMPPGMVSLGAVRSPSPSGQRHPDSLQRSSSRSAMSNRSGQPRSSPSASQVTQSDIFSRAHVRDGPDRGSHLRSFTVDDSEPPPRAGIARSSSVVSRTPERTSSFSGGSSRSPVNYSHEESGNSHQRASVEHTREEDYQQQQQQQQRQHQQPSEQRKQLVRRSSMSSPRSPPNGDLYNLAQAPLVRHTSNAVTASSNSSASNAAGNRFYVPIRGEGPGGNDGSGGGSSSYALSAPPSRGRRGKSETYIDDEAPQYQAGRGSTGGGAVGDKMDQAIQRALANRRKGFAQAALAHDSRGFADGGYGRGPPQGGDPRRWENEQRGSGAGGGQGDKDSMWKEALDQYADATRGVPGSRTMG
eukprot:TRINITY_DN1233_c0_g2_i1.p1 TRINITY_DN1233_c0_g2~~TRINITY_DN1233_c0_g2_i1.p1  ORF type:complete len:1095 (+),score=150.11 TRINITY_DN1233_c0_g2_i1:404-3688(+)